MNNSILESHLFNTILEAIGVGILTLIVGLVIFYFGVDKSKREDAIKYDKILGLRLFLIGFFLHIMLEYAGFNKSYCVNKLKKN